MEIPAASPHFGGLWEAGVKSVKGHLKRVLGETLLTYEEFTTLLHQVEACLNSRPIDQHSGDPRDLEPLTPGHFLIGRPLIAPPEPDVSNEEIHQRWKLVTKLQQDIWKRWSQEYLSLLQQRSKWRTKGQNPKIDELVLVKDDNLPPQKWSLGRIVQLYRREDGIVRIVSVKYKDCVKKRPLNKLCQLPTNIHNSEDEGTDITAVSAMTTILSQKRSKRNICKRVRSTEREAELWSTPKHFDQIKTKKASDSPLMKRKRVKIAPCTWATRMLNTTLLLLYWLTIVFAQGYEIFQPKSGFYIENLGYAQIKRGNLRLQVTLSIDEVLLDQKTINSTWLQINEMCAKTKELAEITHCDTLFRHLSTRQYNLLRDTDEILQLLQHKTRNKRGILGNLLTSVFGVNDEVYTELELLQNNHQILSQSTNQQILFLNSKINQTTSAAEKKLKQFDMRLSQVIGSINEMASWYSKADHNKISIEVIATYLSAEDYYDELQEKYERWLNAIHEHGHLLDFVTSYDIKESANNVSRKLSSNLFIDQTPQRRLEVKMETNNIKLHGYLNIVERSNYELIHVTPIPHLITNNSFVIADLEFYTLAIDFDQLNYFSLEKEELRSCSITGTRTHLCTPTIVHNIDDNPSCVIDEIYSRHLKTSCKMKHVQITGTVWKAMMMKNTWLYVTKEPKVAAVICKGTRKEILLNATGIIHLHDDCFIRTKEVTLKTAIDENADVISSHIKETIPAMAKINFNSPPSILPPGLLIRPDEHILDYSVEPDLSYSTKLHKTAAVYSATATTSSLLIVILGILAWKYWTKVKGIFQSCRRGHRKEQGPPLPRRNTSPNESIQQHFDRVLASGGPQHVHI